MDREEALYAAVGEEVRQGHIRQGLWAKALAEEGYDEQRAKARYLKLRVRSLRSEIAEAEANERARNRELNRQQRAIAENEQAQSREHQKRQHEQAIQSGFYKLDRREAGLSHLQQTRKRMRTAGFWLPFLLVSSLVAIISKSESGTLFLAAVIGLLAGALGFVVAEVIRWFMPSQRLLQREEADIANHRSNLEYAQKSWLGKLSTNLVELLIGIIAVLWLAGMIFRHLGK